MLEGSVTTALKALRTEAGVGVREMARRLGVSTNSYSHYENPSRFKGTYLPMDRAIRFADALAPEGIDRSRVLALAGADDAIPPEGIDARAARLSRRRYSMLLDLLSDLEAAEAADQARRETPADDEG